MESTGHARLASLKSSVFVRGFPSGSATEEALVKIFSQFGPVKKAYIDTTKGAYAIVEFTDENCAFAALSQSNNLYLNEKRLVVKPREIKKTSVKPDSVTKTIVDSYKPSTSKKPQKAPKSKISVSNSSTTEFVQLQNTSHSQDKHSILTDDLIKKLSCSNSVDDRIKLFYQETRLSDEGVAQSISICNLIEQACNLVVPNCKVVPYGSLISGFGSYKSDLDICILTDCTREDENFISRGYLNIKDVTYSFCIGDTGPTMPGPATADVDLQLLAYAISMHVPGALRVRSIKTAKCPVIKFYFAPADKDCDVTINNRLALCNSFLLKKYSQLDSRLAPLVCILCAMIRAAGINGRVFNSYSISLMVIHALQCCTPPVLPCLQDIGDWPLTTATGSELFLPYGSVEGWPFSFHPIENLCPTSNELGLGALLNYIVSFYSTTFDFKTSAITIHKNTMLNIKSAIEMSKSNNSSNSTRVFRVGPMCIQDPIELSHNVSQNLTVPPFTSLLQKFSAASDLLHVSSVSHESEHVEDFLQLFRTTRPSIKKMHFYAVDISSEKAAIINTPVSGESLFENQLAKSVVIILEKDLAFECTCISEVQEHESVSIDEEEPVESDSKKLIHSSDAIMSPVCEPQLEVPNRRQKRPLCDHDLVMAAAKRPRLHDSISSVNSGLSESNDTNISLQYVCKSTCNTWTNRRKTRRKGIGMDSNVVQVDYSYEPIEFTITVLTNFPSDVELAARVLLVPAQTCNVKNFQEFFAFFKKHLLHYSIEQELLY